LGKGIITSTAHIRAIVQECFDQAIERLIQDGFQDDAETLLQATMHWLRHTSILKMLNADPEDMSETMQDTAPAPGRKSLSMMTDDTLMKALICRRRRFSF